MGRIVINALKGNREDYYSRTHGIFFASRVVRNTVTELNPVMELLPEARDTLCI